MGIRTLTAFPERLYGVDNTPYTFDVITFMVGRGPADVPIDTCQRLTPVNPLTDDNC